MKRLFLILLPCLLAASLLAQTNGPGTQLRVIPTTSQFWRGILPLETSAQSLAALGVVTSTNSIGTNYNLYVNGTNTIARVYVSNSVPFVTFDVISLPFADLTGIGFLGEWQSTDQSNFVGVSAWTAANNNISNLMVTTLIPSTASAGVAVQTGPNTWSIGTNVPPTLTAQQAFVSSHAFTNALGTNVPLGQLFVWNVGQTLWVVTNSGAGLSAAQLFVLNNAITNGQQNVTFSNSTIYANAIYINGQPLIANYQTTFSFTTNSIGLSASTTPHFQFPVLVTPGTYLLSASLIPYGATANSEVGFAATNLTVIAGVADGTNSSFVSGSLVVTATNFYGFYCKQLSSDGGSQPIISSNSIAWLYKLK